MKKIEYLKKIIYCIVAVFAFYVAIWMVFCSIRYVPFIKKMPSGIKIYESNELIYQVRRPSFPSFSGNLAISPRIIGTPETKDQLDFGMVIWPTGFDGYKFIVTVYISNVDYENRSSHTEMIGILLDENGNMAEQNDDDPDMYERKKLIFDTRKTEIYEIYDAVEDMWGIIVPR